MKRFLLSAAVALLALPSSYATTGWLTWRGPLGTSVSTEKGLPTKPDAKSPLWEVDFPGQSTPAIADGRLYINGYLGEGQDLQEITACFDAETGKEIWRHGENDFLSDTVYSRYATSSPTVDPETGNVYALHTQGLFMAFSPDGKLLWQHSMMEEFGRLTFPNCRTASPIVDHELVITRGITSAWGAHGPAGDRFYAFDKKTGELVWSSSPADRPQDNTFSQPWLDVWGGKRVLYSAGGDSSVLALNARTGEPLWRFPFAKAGAKGGINAALVRYHDSLIALHESENLDSSEIGRMASFRIPKPEEIHPPNPTTPQVLEGKTLEQWRNGVGSLASSPVLVGDTIYEVNGTGELCAVEAVTGKVLWKKKVGIEQRQSSPFYADGYLYVGMYVTMKDGSNATSADADSVANGDLIVLKPGPDGAEEVARTQVTGRVYGSPVGYNGKLYLQTDKKLYAFGKTGMNPGLAAAAPVMADWPAPGPAKELQVIPYEILLRPGQTQSFHLRILDANGFTVQENVDPKSVHWESFIPPTALVKATLKGSFNAEGQFVADKAPVGSGGQFKATLKLPDGTEIAGYFKGRVLAGIPLKQNFEAFAVTNLTTNAVEPPTLFAYPPLPWNSARFRFEVRVKDPTGGTNQALMKTIDDRRFQRGQVFFGFPDMTNYTVEADVLSEGNKRKMSEVGLINQRYAIILKGNSQQLEVNSNQERVKVAVQFKWVPETWYHLKTRVDVAADGSGIVRAKAWKKGDPEPEAWTIEVPHKHAHANGSPGLYGFSPQDMRVAIDNISVTAN
ncbi:MAG TPA: PQQ-binding-like beta-propeller repeat protein [Candidatus Limnocylindria bacterium]|nr:PQQ-binding-like beta-propeller repeat protein [Candidatus Limnocylindria bacterium]